METKRSRPIVFCITARAIIVTVVFLLSTSVGAEKIFATGEGQFVHRATAANVAGHMTRIDNSLTNDDPNAIIFVTRLGMPVGGSINDNHVIGVFYSNVTRKWAILNQDQQPMRVGATFNVVVMTPSASVFVHRATASNIRGYQTQLRAIPAALQPNTIVLVTANWTPDGESVVFNNHPVAAYFGSSRWSVINQDRAAMPVGAAFNVALIDPSALAFSFQNPLVNSKFDIDRPEVDNDPNAIIVVTPVGFDPTASNNGPIGLFYRDNQWYVFNQNGVSFGANRAFNVVVRKNASAANGLMTAPAVAPQPRRYRVTLLGFTCRHQTNDNILNADGRGDEIYLAAAISTWGRDARPISSEDKRTVVMGDSGLGGSYDRLAIGNLSPEGGIGNGFTYLPRTNPIGRYSYPTLPLVIYNGIIDDNHLVLIEPTIWESDGGTRYELPSFATWVQNPDAIYPLRDFIRAAWRSPTGIPPGKGLGPVVDDVESGDYHNPYWPYVGQPLDRPIGITPPRYDGDDFFFNPKMLILTLQAAQRAVTTTFPMPAYQRNNGDGTATRSQDITAPNPGLIPIEYRDADQYGGDYILYLKIEEVRN